MRSAGSLELRDLIAHFTEQVEAHLGARIESAVERAVGAARPAARRELAEDLNHAVRRLRQCADTDEVLTVLKETAAPFCDRVALFTISGGVARSANGQEFPLESAGAFGSAAESGEPVIAAASPAEIGQGNVEFFAHPSDDRVYLFPVTSRQTTVGILYATAGTRDVEIAALELLSGAASAVVGGLSAPPQSADKKAEAASLVEIRRAGPAAEIRQPQWSGLSAAEQEAHLRAQRLARVLVAEMRLYRPDAVHSGRTRRDVYAVLKNDIDRAREKFRQTCFSECPSMVDYLHVELARSLANDDVRLLGPSYPGPLQHENTV